jgi:hypothetical protein
MLKWFWLFGHDGILVDDNAEVGCLISEPESQIATHGEPSPTVSVVIALVLVSELDFRCLKSYIRS